MEDHRSTSLVYSDLTDSSRWSCPRPPVGAGPRATAEGDMHPALQFSSPLQRVHVHLKDMAAGPTGHVLWDATYDLGGTESLKSSATSLGGSRPEFELFCPPLSGPPHWYELTVTKARRPGATRLLEDFVGSQVLTAYRPEHDPEVIGLGSGPVRLGGDTACAVQ